MEDEMIYTHDEAMLIVEMFEDVLSKYNISIPSDEDDEREEDNMVGLYGSTYSDLFDSVEENICSILARCKRGEKIIENEFSGTV
jgi:hypothetical protein